MKSKASVDFLIHRNSLIWSRDRLVLHLSKRCIKMKEKEEEELRGQLQRKKGQRQKRQETEEEDGKLNYVSCL
jgi:hypothetical protein